MRQIQELFSSFKSLTWGIAVGLFLLTLSSVLYTFARLLYSESKGPFKNWTQVVDLDEDGDLDVLISHTRWETAAISWAGIGRWINQGNGTFKLIHDTQMNYFAGYAGAATDVDRDKDMDVFLQDIGVRLLIKHNGIYTSNALIDHLVIQKYGHADMGGKITVGDLNGDNKMDALITGCCYGVNQTLPSSDYLPSASWVWINDGNETGFQTGHILTMDFLDGYPIRDAALGDLDGDGDLDAFAAIGLANLGINPSLSDLILLNDGTGKFTTFDQQLDNIDSTSVALGDINGDGGIDALVGTNTGARLWINQNNGAKTGLPIFAPAERSFDTLSTFIEQLTGWNPPVDSTRTAAVFLEDLDQDGHLDALIAQVYEARIWWNDGVGNFQRSNTRLTYKEDTGIAVGDFNGDGSPDIFVGDNNDNYQVWFNDGGRNFKPSR